MGQAERQARPVLRLDLRQVADVGRSDACAVGRCTALGATDVRCAPTAGRPFTWAGEWGQSTLEATLVLPVLLLALLLIVQVALIGRDAMSVHWAAAAGAREAAVTADDARIVAAALRAAGAIDPSRLSVAVSPAPDERDRGEPITVSVTASVVMRVPVVGPILTRLRTLHASSTSRLERSGHCPTPAPSTPSPSPTEPASPSPAPYVTPTPRPCPWPPSPTPAPTASPTPEPASPAPTPAPTPSATP